MHKPRAISLLCVTGLSLISPCLTATTLTAQSQAARVLDQAKELYSKGENEAAAILFYQALHYAQGNRKDSKVVTSVGKLLKIVDPVTRQRTIGYKKAARGLMNQAKSYKRLKWFDLAIHLAFESQDLDPKGAKAMLKGLGRAAPAAFRDAKRLPKPVAVDAPVARQATGWKLFEPEQVAAYDWKEESGVHTMTSKPAAAAFALFDRQSAGQAAVSAEFKRTDSTGGAGMLFGARNYQDFYMVEVIFRMNQSVVRLLRWDSKKESTETIKSGWVRLTRDARKDWVRVAVHIEDQGYAILINGKEVFKVKTRSQPEGRMGYFVPPGKSGSVSFRSPYIGPIRKKPTPKKAAPEKNPVFEALDGIEKNIGETPAQKQKAVLELFALQRKNIFAGDEKVSQRIEELLGSACLEYAKLSAARTEAATALLEVAKRYEAAGWKQLARTVLVDAAVFSEAAATRLRGPSKKAK